MRASWRRQGSSRIIVSGPRDRTLGLDVRQHFRSRFCGTGQGFTPVFLPGPWSSSTGAIERSLNVR